MGIQGHSARAGKHSSAMCSWNRSPIHPRVCGEAVLPPFYALAAPGPSPRVRGSRPAGGSVPASPTRAAWRRPASAAVTVAENCSSRKRWLTARPGQPTCEILVLTAVRPGEARGARWEEIDFGEAAWTIPAARMKATREHRVPLSAREIEVLHATERLRTGSTPAQSAGLVFPSAPGKQLADARLSKLLEQLGVGAVPQGFRSSFRDWASERTNHLRPVVEAALAHIVRGQTVACCDHAFGNSTPCCSNSASPAALVMRALRFSHSISSTGSFPPWSCASRSPVPVSEATAVPLGAPPAAALIPCRAPCAWRRLRSPSLAGCARACGSPGRTARTSGTSRAAATAGGCRSGPAALLSHRRCRSSSW